MPLDDERGVPEQKQIAALHLDLQLRRFDTGHQARLVGLTQLAGSMSAGRVSGRCVALGWGMHCFVQQHTQSFGGLVVNGAQCVEGSQEPGDTTLHGLDGPDPSRLFHREVLERSCWGPVQPGPSDTSQCSPAAFLR